MATNAVTVLNSDEGRALVRKKCRSAKIPISVLEELIEAELDQQGKKRKAGLWDEIDRILDDLDSRESA
jgi:hypothetical protein